MFPRAAILVTCSQSSLLVPCQVPEWTSQHLLWHGRLWGERTRSDSPGCCSFGGGAGEAAPSLPKSRIPALAWSSGCTWGAPGVMHRENGGMERAGGCLLSPPPSSLAGLSVSYKNVLVMCWFWWQALAGVAVPSFELAKLNHTAQAGGVATVIFPPSSTHPKGQKTQLAVF